MKRRNFFAGMGALVAASCAREEKRAARYNEKECPFCSPEPGVCSYCHGGKTCTFCGGTGKRVTVSPDLPEQQLKKAQYSEDCPYCKGAKTCRYCDGVGKCWACHGTGKIENWDLFDKGPTGKS